MKMKKDDHLPLRWLEEAVLDVVEENVHPVSLQSGVAETVVVGLESALYSPGADDGTHVEVLQTRVALGDAQLQRILLHIPLSITQN